MLLLKLVWCSDFYVALTREMFLVISDESSVCNLKKGRLL